MGEKMRDLTEIRKSINEIDDELLELFMKRMDCAKEVAEYKKEKNIPILNEAREKEILDKIEKKGGEYGVAAKILYSNIMELSRELQHSIINESANDKPERL